MVVRAFSCRPLRPAFDIALRDVLLPDLCDCAGVLDACVGRKGPDELGGRLVVSLWVSLEAMHRSMGGDIETSRFHPELLEETTERRLEVLPVILLLGEETTTPVGVLRVARGTLHDMSVEDYADQVRAGVEDDRAHGHGPRWLVLARGAERGFVTISRWPDWSSIALATGASIHDPTRTKRLTEIRVFKADHYELLPVGGREDAPARPDRGALL
ncbi:hypothetical protein BH23CHL8_BH23CHL8_28440 [soil metagenome]